LAQLSPSGQIVCIIRSMSPDGTIGVTTGCGANSFGGRGAMADGAGGAKGTGDGFGIGRMIAGEGPLMVGGAVVCAFATGADMQVNSATIARRMKGPFIGASIVLLPGRDSSDWQKPASETLGEQPLTPQYL
jgi:hypothetical protein